MITKIIIVLLFILLLFIIIKNFDQKDCEKTQAIKTLVRQAARWSTAANQDKSPIIAILHANYGAGYLWALKDIATDNEIEKATGIDVLKFRDEIIKVQDNASKKMLMTCPKFSPEKTYLSQIAKEN